MRVPWLYAGDDGESHFATLEFPLTLQESGTMASDFLQTEGLQFRNNKLMFLDFHPAPRRQFILFMSGRQEIEVASGEKMVCSPGDVLLVDDTEGHGHISRRTEPGLSVWVSVPKSLDLTQWRVE